MPCLPRWKVRLRQRLGWLQALPTWKQRRRKHLCRGSHPFSNTGAYAFSNSGAYHFSNSGWHVASHYPRTNSDAHQCRHNGTAHRCPHVDTHPSVQDSVFRTGRLIR